MIGTLMKRIFGTHAARAQKRMWPMVAEVNEWYEKFDALSDEQIQAKTGEFRERLQDGETIDDLLPEAFAVVKQACKRHVGQNWVAHNIPIEWVEIPYDVQILGGIVLHEGKIAEMATGEGKTLVAIFPLYLNALEGRGAHLATFNDFLAQLGAEWTGRILRWLGLTVGCMVQNMDPQERRKQYACDVTYGQSSEFGFDYLRDNMTGSAAYLVQGARSLVSQEIVDEIKTRVDPVEGAQIVTDRFQTLIVEAPEAEALALVRDFGGRFSVESMTLFYAGTDDGSPAPEKPARLPVFERVFESPEAPAEGVRLRVQFAARDHRYAIVDEVDSLLIDEARTPLIISGQVDRSTQRYDQMRPLVENLVKRQSALVKELLGEAERLLASGKDDDRYEAGIKLLQVKKSMPKNKRFIGINSEPEYNRLITRVENDFIIDQKSKMAEKRMGYVESDLFFVIDEKGHSVDLTDKGREIVSPDDPDRFLLADIVEDFSRIEGDESLTPEEREAKKATIRQENDRKSEELHNISQLLRAYTLYEKDDEYIVEDNKVVIVDEFTGRPQPGRRYSDGLHQAIEAKEHVKIEKESQTLATITIQNYFRMYEKRAGMTGTAETEAAEFGHTYQMDVVVIPTHRPISREDMNDVIFRTRREKFNAVVQEVARLHALGLPILIGTVSVDVSELLSRMLRRAGISHNVLNAKHIAREAEIVRNAGQKGAVTIATNMAGRGTDIKLGRGVIKCKDGESHDGAYCPACPFKPEGARVEKDMQPCGLQIIGTERHEARRIDRQLRGRAGRQGDPGSSRFFLSLEDELMRLFGSDRIAGVMSRLGLEEGEQIEHPFITRAITRAQKKVEERNFEYRKRTLDYDNVMNKQRETIYGLRRGVLVSEDLRESVLDLCFDAINKKADDYRREGGAAKEGPSVAFDYEGFEGSLNLVVPGLDLEGLEREDAELDAYVDEIIERVGGAYDLKRRLLGRDLTTELARYIILSVIDSHWRDHLRGIDELREGIHLRSYGQLDPLIEYQREATYMFQDMMAAINEAVLNHFFRANVVTEQRPAASSQIDYGRGSIDPGAAGGESAAVGAAGEHAAAGRSDQPTRARTFKREEPKVGRNDPCPCGSGRKYKQCCGKR